MKKNKKYLIISIIVVLLLVILGGVLIIVKKKQDNKYIDKKEVVAVTNDIISEQAKIDEEINDYIKSNKYTLDNPKIIVNPYEISPLSALIIFKTKKEVSYEVSVNGTKLTTTESSKSHSIPIYGLRAGYTNTITLTTSDGTTKSYEITTSEDPYSLDVKKSELVEKDNFYFLAGPMGFGYGAFDIEGNLVWYTTITSTQDLEFLSNGHILVCNGETMGADTYTGFYEIDYLGKIYKRYILENGYHHEVNELSNGNLIVAGYDNSSPIENDYISIIDQNTGEKLSYLSLYEVIKNVDSTFASTLDGTDVVVNSIDYNEETNELLLSVRGLNTIMSINYQTKEINYMIAKESDWSSNFSKYILKGINTSDRIPQGAHTAFYTEDGYLAVFNNDYNVNTKETLLSNFKDNYSAPVYYKLDLNNKTFTTKWEYFDDTHSFSYAMGGLNITSDNHKLINYGWNFARELFDKNDTYIYNYLGVTYSKILELDENDNILFEAEFPESTYRAFKNKLYEEITNNFIPETAKIIDTTPFTNVEEVETSSIQDKLDNAINGPYTIDLTKKTISINCLFDILEKVDIVFVSNNGKSYIYNYKAANEPSSYSVNFNLTGKYAIYLVVDDVYYETPSSVDFDLD